MSETEFDDLSDVYEAMIDWPRRLANETQLFRSLFEQFGVRRVADAACGTGRHAALFHSWGLGVLGLDISPQMIRQARASCGESDSLRWSVQSFDQPIGPPGAFDAVVCIGNSLALVPDASAMERAVRQLLEAVRPGGLLMVHVLNLWKLPAGPCLWQKAIRRTLRSGESLILKGVHRCGQTGYVELAVIGVATADVSIRARSVPFLGLKAADLEAAARRHGAVEVSFYGSYQREPYEPGSSTDLIMVAGKAG
jgi:SAM-dependent methyltransferase